MLWQQFEESQRVLNQYLLEWMMIIMTMMIQWWKANLHGKSVEGDRDWSVLSQPSSNFCKESQIYIKIKTLYLTNQYITLQLLLWFSVHQLNTLTLLVLGQLHRGVDVGCHLAGAEATALLVSAVRVVALWLQATWANTGSDNKGGWKLQWRCSGACMKLTAYPASRWLHRHWMADLHCKPCQLYRSRPALGGTLKKIQQFFCSCVQRQVNWGKQLLRCFIIFVVRQPCSDRESSFPFLRNHCPSMLPVTEKAQQDPHMPCRTHSQYTEKLTAEL